MSRASTCCALAGHIHRCTRPGNTAQDLRFTDTITYRLEERRKAKGAAYYERKKLAVRQLSEAKKNAKVDTKTAKALESYGY